MRLIGPRFDAADNAAFHLAGGTLEEWFDVLVHRQAVTPNRHLPDPAAPDSDAARPERYGNAGGF